MLRLVASPEPSQSAQTPTVWSGGLRIAEGQSPWLVHSPLETTLAVPVIAQLRHTW